MEFIDKIEARAAAKAIYRTVREIEKEFKVKAKGSTPKAKRRSVIQALKKKIKVQEKKIRKLRKRRG